jgi:hypothetical protein
MNSMAPFSDSKLDRLNGCIDALLRATQDGDRFQGRSPEFVSALRCAKGELLNEGAAE